MSKLYIANQTCSQAVQIIANELGLTLELVHYNVFDKSTSNGDDFSEVNSLGYVPVFVADDADGERLSETIVVVSYLADKYPASALIPAHGTIERVRVDQLLTFVATEIAQKHIPLMRKLMTPEGVEWTRNKIISAYAVLDQRLADGRAWLNGDAFTVVDAYVWATMWHERSGARIEHLQNLMAWKARVDARPSVRKALRDEADVVALHESLSVA